MTSGSSDTYNNDVSDSCQVGISTHQSPEEDLAGAEGEHSLGGNPAVSATGEGSASDRCFILLMMVIPVRVLPALQADVITHSLSHALPPLGRHSLGH